MAKLSRVSWDSPEGRPLSDFEAGDLVEITGSEDEGEVGHVILIVDNGYVDLETADVFCGDFWDLDKVYGVALPVGEQVTLENEDE